MNIGVVLYLVLCGAVACWTAEIFGWWDAWQQLLEGEFKRRGWKK